MRNKLLRIVIAPILLLNSFSYADDFWLKDGTHIVGTIIKYGGGQISVKTEFIGTVTIKSESIVGITTDKPYSVGTGADDEFIGFFVYKDDTQTFVEDNGESDTIELSDIELVWDAGEPRPKPDYWSGTAELSIVGENADDNDVLLMARTRIRRETDSDTLFLDLRFKYEIEDDSVTETEYNFLGRYDWDRGDDLWHNFVKLEAEHDKFDELDIRLALTVGAARDIIKSDHRNFTIRTGLGWFFEQFEDDSTNSDPMAEFGYEYDRTYREFLKIEDDVRFNVLLTDLSDFRFVHEFAGLVPLTRDKDWQLKVSMINELLSDTSGEQSTWETDYTLSLVYNW